MIKRTIISISMAVAMLMSWGAAQAADGPHVAPIKAFIAAEIVPWLSDPIVIDAIKAQNVKNSSLSAEDIDKLDKTWRSETEASSRPMIDGVLANALSTFLAGKKDASGGMISEMFVMDAKGLNVGQSDVTSDYWQGDEGKWKNTYLVGPNTVFVDEVEQDESSQTLQSQASVSIVDPASGEVIGAITIGINVDTL